MIEENLVTANAISPQSIETSTHLFSKRRRSGERRGTKRRRSHVVNNYAPHETAAQANLPIDIKKMHLDDPSFFLPNSKKCL